MAKAGIDGNGAAADAREAFNSTVLELQMQKSPALADLAKSLGAQVNAGLAQASGAEARSVASIAPDKGEGRGA